MMLVSLAFTQLAHLLVRFSPLLLATVSVKKGREQGGRSEEEKGSNARERLSGHVLYKHGAL